VTAALLVSSLTSLFGIAVSVVLWGLVKVNRRRVVRAREERDIAEADRKATAGMVWARQHQLDAAHAEVMRLQGELRAIKLQQRAGRFGAN